MEEVNTSGRNLRKVSISISTPPKFEFDKNNETEENSPIEEQQNHNTTQIGELETVNENPSTNSNTIPTTTDSNSRSPRDESESGEKVSLSKLKKRKSVFSWVSKNLNLDSHFHHNSLKKTESDSKATGLPKLESAKFEHLRFNDLGEEDRKGFKNEGDNEREEERNPRLKKRSKSEIMEKILINSKKNGLNSHENSQTDLMSERKESTFHSAPKISLSNTTEVPRMNFSKSLPYTVNVVNVQEQNENDDSNLLTPRSASIHQQKRRSTPLMPSPRIDGGSVTSLSTSPIEIKTKTNEVRRREVLQEIIQTEVQYIENLDVILNVFLEPIREANILDKFQLSSIFSNVEAIYPVNVALLNDLRTLQSQLEVSDVTPPTLNIGKIFSDKADLFKLYAVYCSNQPNIHDRLEVLVDDSEELDSFLKKCFRRPECRKLDIESFLITPLQRLCKYPLLLKEVLKNTAEDHLEYEDIKEGKEKIEIIVNKVNERVRQVENLNKLISVNKEIDFSSFAFDILNDRNRVLVLEDDIKISGKCYSGYLFSDGLLLCAIKTTTKEAKKFIPAKLALATDIPEIPPDIVNRFELAEVGGKILEIECPSRISKKRWLTNLQKVIEAAGGTSKKDKERAIRALRRASIDPPIHKPKPLPTASKLKEESSSRLSRKPSNTLQEKEREKEKENRSSDKSITGEKSSSGLLSLFGVKGPSVKKITENFEKKPSEQSTKITEKPKKLIDNANQRISFLESELTDMQQIYNVIKTLLKEERDMNEQYEKKIQSLEETIRVMSLNSNSAIPPPTQSDQGETLQTQPLEKHPLEDQLSIPISDNNNINNNIDNNNSFNDSNDNTSIEHNDQLQREEEMDEVIKELFGDESQIERDDNTSIRDVFDRDIHDPITIQLNDIDLEEKFNIHINDQSFTESSSDYELTPRFSYEITPKTEVEVLKERLHFLNEVVEKMTEENVRLRTKLHIAKQKLKEFDYSLNLTIDEKS